MQHPRKDSYLALINQGRQRSKQRSRDRDEIATYGDSSGVLQERINKLSAMLLVIGMIPVRKVVHVIADTSAAITNIDVFTNRLNSIPRTVTVGVNVVGSTIVNVFGH